MTDEQIATLRACRFLRNREEVSTFDSTLSDVGEQGGLHRADTESLYLLLEDSSEQQEALWGLLHFIEELDYGIWLPAFVAVLPKLKDHAPEWADTITSRILNGEESREALGKILKDVPEGRRAILPILAELSLEQRPRLQKLRQRAEEMLTEIRSYTRDGSQREGE